MKRLLSATAAAGLTGAVIALGATSAAAHVTVDADTTEAGSYAVLTFSVPHGCGSSATTGIAIEIPEEFNNITPTVHPRWDVDVVMEDVPVDGDDDQSFERPAEVIYTAHTPLPADLRDTMELSVLLPDTPGETLAFPVVQTCEEGTEDWVETPGEGQDADELQMPAPALTVTDGASEHDATDEADAEPSGSEAADAGDGADGAQDAPTEESGGAQESGAAEESGAAQEPAAGDGGTAPTAIAWIALGLGAGGLLLGALAFMRTRKA